MTEERKHAHRRKLQPKVRVGRLSVLAETFSSESAPSSEREFQVQ